MGSAKSLMWTYFVASVVLTPSNCDTVGNDSIVAVSRRPSNDIQYFQTTCNNNLCHSLCDGVNTTYLVAEQHCVNNSNLFNECSFAMIPTGEPHLLRLTIKSVEGTSRLETFRDIDNTYTNATIILVTSRDSREHVQVNSSVCNISTLEVYRGREQAIEISHEGFSLGDNGTIEIRNDQLAYNYTEYGGELYRMNLSCDSFDSETLGGTPPVNDCLYFKVYGHTTVADAKFNCKVPGTIRSVCECTQTMTTATNRNLETTAPQSQSPMITTTTEETQLRTSGSNNKFSLEMGSPLFYGVVAAGSGIIFILLLCLIGVSILACRWGHACGENNYTDKQGQSVYEDIVIRNGATTSGYTNNLAYTNTMNGFDDPSSVAEQDFTSHKYQEIGAAYQEILPVVKDPNRYEWGVTNPGPNLFQLNSEHVSQEYSTLNHDVGGQKVVNHCNESTTATDSQQYAKLNDNH